MEAKDRINRYVMNFRRFIMPYQKQDVSLKSTVYQYGKDGAVIVFEMNFNASNNNEFRSLSPTMIDALKKTGLFDTEGASGNISVPKVLLNGNFIVVIRSGDDEQWNADRAKEDVTNLLKKISEK